jgi:hypothetical protein
MNVYMYKMATVFVVSLSLSLTAWGANGDRMRKNVLSTNEIAELQTQVSGKREGENILFSADFKQLTRLSATDRARHAGAGTIPFHITADYVQLRMGSNNRSLRQRLPGSVHMYVCDSDGKIVANQSMLVERMCPT